VNTKLSILALLCLASIAVAQDDPAPSPGDDVQKQLDFTLKDQDGKTHKLSDAKDKIVVLEWVNKDCPFVQRQYDGGAMQALATKWQKSGVVWLAIDSTHYRTVAQAKAWATEKNVQHPILLDPSGDVGRLFGAKTTPHMFILKDGSRLYDGAIDDGASGEATANYVDQALGEITKGKDVTTSRTRPYGCAVKYAKAKADG
jgi:peroxiredoxin